MFIYVVRPDVELESMWRAMSQAAGSLVYGVSSGPEITDMRPFRQVADRFLQTVRNAVNSIFVR